MFWDDEQNNRRRPKLSPAARIKELESLVERQQAQIERMRAVKFKLPTGKVSLGKGKAFTRVFVPDTHGAHIDPEAAKAFLSDLELLRPTEVIFMGDHLDCGGLLAQHHVLGTVPETETTNRRGRSGGEHSFGFGRAAHSRRQQAVHRGHHESRIEEVDYQNHARQARHGQQDAGDVWAGNRIGVREAGYSLYQAIENLRRIEDPGTIDLGDCLARTRQALRSNGSSSHGLTIWLQRRNRAHTSDADGQQGNGEGNRLLLVLRVPLQTTAVVLRHGPDRLGAWLWNSSRETGQRLYHTASADHIGEELLRTTR
jgi:hypothetical protein